MVKATMEIRTKAVILYEEGVYSAPQISRMYNISERTLRRWNKSYNYYGIDGLNLANLVQGKQNML